MRWSVVVPVYNEAAYLPRTLASLAAQTIPFRLILVDNGSTDTGIAAARDFIAEHRLDAEILSEPVSGQVHALRAGIARVATELVAICDADTFYPPHYLATAGRLFDARGDACVACCAWPVPETGGRLKRLARAAHRLGVARLLPRQNHVSGAGQSFRTTALRAAGGYDAALWPYVLKDHELMHRVLQLGSQAYAADLWCIPSERRADRRAVRWRLVERLRYHLTPFARKTAFFRDYLKPRFAARGQADTVLRAGAWRDAAEVSR